jgi:hypothetical protein
MRLLFSFYTTRLLYVLIRGIKNMFKLQDTRANVDFSTAGYILQQQYSHLFILWRLTEFCGLLPGGGAAQVTPQNSPWGI